MLWGEVAIDQCATECNLDSPDLSDDDLHPTLFTALHNFLKCSFEAVHEVNRSQKNPIRLINTSNCFRAKDNESVRF